MDFTTFLELDAATFSGVRYRIRRVSFAGRLELTRRIGGLLARLSFLAAGASPEERVRAAELAGEIDRLYLDWGLVSIDGLTIDGAPCTRQLLIERAPEALAREIVAAIRRECALTEEERKNS
jgi:hypothetical protein